MKSIIYGAAILLVLANTAIAKEGQACANRTAFLKHLSDTYKETPVAMGLAANGGLLEVIASEDGSWTIIVTMPNGISCGVASGMSWESVIKVDKDPEA